MPFSSCRMKGRHSQCDPALLPSPLSNWPRWGLSVPLFNGFLLSRTVLFGKKSLREPTPKEVGTEAPSLRAEWLHQLFRILHKRLVHSPPFIDSIIYVYEDGLMNIYFILRVISQYSSIYFMAHTGPALAIGSSSSGLLCPCDTFPSLGDFF